MAGVSLEVKRQNLHDGVKSMPERGKYAYNGGK
jgi:hypothetical protein